MNPINMTCYIKRFWKGNALTILFLVILCGLQVGANLLMMQSFQGIIDRNMRRFIFWMLLLVVVWFSIYGLTGAGIGCVNIVCQMLHVTLIGVLSVRGIILQGALTGGGNLCGNLSAGLSNMTQDVLSMTSARPYFEKIFASGEKTIASKTETTAEMFAGMHTETMQTGTVMAADELY